MMIDMHIDEPPTMREGVPHSTQQSATRVIPQIWGQYQVNSLGLDLVYH